MIRDDRIQLNDRFRKVFDLLVERGDIVPNDRSGKGIGDFADKILGNRAYGHIVRAFLNDDDKRCIDYRHARTLCREYGVNETYLIDGVGTPFGFDLPRPTPADEEAVAKKGNILFTTVEAFAGSTTGRDGWAQEDLSYFNIPGLAGNGLVAFPIKGNSMEPLISNGDVVVCREVQSMAEVKDNKIYAVKQNGSIWVKYVQKIQGKNDRTVALKLISANHLEHDPFTEDVNEHTRLYQVVRKISDLD
jgi:hypothetical protein